MLFNILQTTLPLNCEFLDSLEPTKMFKTQVRETWSLHVREDVVQLRPGADVAQKHVIHLWGEVFLGDGVILQQITVIWLVKWQMYCMYMHSVETNKYK